MTMAEKRSVVVVAGPTAVGKTEYALRIAERLDGEIISADSMQLYRYLDIGSAKPTPEERARVQHYLVDEIDPREPFSAALYQKRAREAINQVFAKGKLPVISGGTGLYVNSLICEMDFSGSAGNEEFRAELYQMAESQGREAVHRLLAEKDPQAAARIHPNNLKKVVRAIEVAEERGAAGAAPGAGGIPDFSMAAAPVKEYGCVLIGLERDREELYDRINRRVDALLSQGLVDEVKRLMEMGLTEENISMKGIGYKELIGCLAGEYDLTEAIRLIKRNTRHYAKRQMTWFRRYKDMKWFYLTGAEPEEALREMTDYIERSLW